MNQSCHHFSISELRNTCWQRSESKVTLWCLGLCYIRSAKSTMWYTSKLVVNGNEGAYVIHTSSPPVESCFIASQLSYIIWHCSKTLSPDSRTSDLGIVTHPQWLSFGIPMKVIIINPVQWHPLYLQYTLDMDRKCDMLTGHGQMRWCAVWTCAEDAVCWLDIARRDGVLVVQWQKR